MEYGKETEYLGKRENLLEELKNDEITENREK